MWIPGAIDDRQAYPNATLLMSMSAGRADCQAPWSALRAAGRSFREPPWALAAGLLGAAFSACAWAGAEGPKARARTHVEPRDTRLVHEDCPVGGAGATGEDINGDGRPDRRTVFGTSGVRCRAFDFDFDGRIDAWVYLDPAGQVRRRENDFDRDGLPDEISLYEHGALVEQQRSTSQAGKLDTWHFFKSGRLARTERDANGDDFVDQWWEYPAQRPSNCPLIHSDVDGDGKPDPGATVDVCRDGDAEAVAADPAPAPPGLLEVPTEVESSEPAAPAASGGPPSPAGSPSPQPAGGSTP